MYSVNSYRGGTIPATFFGCHSVRPTENQVVSMVNPSISQVSRCISTQNYWSLTLETGLLEIIKCFLGVSQSFFFVALVILRQIVVAPCQRVCLNTLSFAKHILCFHPCTSQRHLNEREGMIQYESAGCALGPGHCATSKRIDEPVECKWMNEWMTWTFKSYVHQHTAWIIADFLQCKVTHGEIYTGSIWLGSIYCRLK